MDCVHCPEGYHGFCVASTLTNREPTPEQAARGIVAVCCCSRGQEA